jgi:PAS domain S-box-containing protein
MAAEHGRMDKDALLGQRMMDAYPGIEQTEMFGELRQCMDTREAKRMVNEFVYADGDRRWFELSIQPAQEGIFILSTDITARKLAEDRIQEQAEDLRMALKEKDDAYSLLDTLMRSAPVGLAFLDQDLRYQRINESLAEINGISVADHIGCSVDEVLPELAPTVVPLFREIMATRKPTLNLEISGETPRAPGQQRDWLASYYPVLASDDRVLGVGLVVMEITERKRAEQAIRDLNADLERRVAERTAQLEARSREMESFSYSVSHDLKAPLRGIDGYSRLLLEEHLSSLNDEGQMFVRTIRQGAQQMNQLIEDLLAYSRLERRELGNASVNPRALIENMIAERHRDLEKFKVNVDITCADVSVDREGLSIALRNVVDNAIKFTQDVPEPAIDIVGRDTPTACVITVRDNGVGFDMKFHDRIFAIFQRLHRMEEYPGTGIGLAIVRKAVERLGGKVWAESEPGHGATFTLELPRIPSP